MIMKNNSKLITFVIIGLVFLGLYLSFEVYQQYRNNQKIMSLTQPMTRVSGTVVSRNDKTVEIRVKQSAFNAQESDSVKQDTYYVIVDDKTIIQQTPSTIPLLDTQQPTTKNVQVESIVKDSFVEITSDRDLRKVNNNRFVAKEITITNFPAIITGKVLGIEGDRVKVSGTINSSAPMSADLLKQGEFEIITDANTKISKYQSTNNIIDPTQPPTVVESQVADLTIGNEVTTYIDLTDYLNNHLLAKTILEMLAQPQTAYANSTPIE